MIYTLEQIYNHKNCLFFTTNPRFTSSFILIADAAPPGAIGSVNGIGQMAASLMLDGDHSYYIHEQKTLTVYMICISYIDLLADSSGVAWVLCSAATSFHGVWKLILGLWIPPLSLLSLVGGQSDYLVFDSYPCPK